MSSSPLSRQWRWNASISNGMSCRRRSRASRSTVELAPRAAISSFTCSAGSTTGSRPIFRQFWRKMSPNDGAMIDVEAVVLQPPGRVLARRAAAEVAAGEQDPRALRRSGRLSSKSGVLLAPVEEEELAEAGALDPLQELLRHDLVGVDVGPVEHRDAPVTRCAAPALTRPARAKLADVDEVPGDRGRRGHLRADEVRAPAARPGGPRSCGSRSTRSARPARGCPGSCPGTSSSRRGATRSRRALKTRSSPSASACRFTCAEPGHDHRADASARPGGPSTTAAAARRSSIRRVRARADEDAVDARSPAIGVPGSSAM